MSRFLNAQNIHQAFTISLWLKAAFALAETVGGIVVYFTTQQSWVRLVRAVTGHELIEDPHDLVANYLQHAVQQFSGSALQFAAFYLLGHGIVKLWLIAGLLRKRLWYYPVSIVVFGMFIVYQLYRFHFTDSISLLLITVLDLIVMVLTWWELHFLRHQLMSMNRALPNSSWASVATAHSYSASDQLNERRWTSRDVLFWLLSNESPRWFVFVAAIVVVGSTWLFFGVLEDVVTHDPLVDVDVVVYRFLQSVRTRPMDSIMVALTELGDSQVLFPVILLVLVWFAIHRLWLTAAYWLVAVGVAELLTKVLKFVLHRQRPGVLYLGIEEFSFPSGHATMSVVVYGFLAILLCRYLHFRQRRPVAMVAIILVTLIAISRLYLGAHWLSDVLGGLAFGTAWISLLAIAHAYESREDVRAQRLAIFFAVILLFFGSIHIAKYHDIDLSRYAKRLTISATY